MTPEEEADIRRTIERLYAEKDELREELDSVHRAWRSEEHLHHATIAERDKLRAELQQTYSAAYNETARLRAERDRLREEREALLRWCDLNEEWYARAVAEMLREGVFSQPPNEQEN